MNEKARATVLVLAGLSLDGFYGDSTVLHFKKRTKRFTQELFNVDNIDQLNAKMQLNNSSQSLFNVEDQFICKSAVATILYREIKDAHCDALFAPIAGFFTNKNGKLAISERGESLLAKVDVIVISTSFILKLDSLRDILNLLKQYNKPIIIGGILVYRLTEIELTNLAFDFCLTTEAEGRLSIILQSIVEANINITKFNSIPGLYWREGNKLQKSNAEFAHVDFCNWSSYPSADWVRNHKGFELYESVRGCPFNCSFCDYPALLGNKIFRYKSAEKIFEDWQKLVELGVRHIECLDSIFTIPKIRMIKLAQLLIKSGLNKILTWSSYARVTELVDRSFVELLKKSGCTYLFMGIESGSQKILDTMCKRTTVEQNIAAIQNCNAVELYTSCGLLIGFPNEDKKTIHKTIELLLQTTSPSIHLTPWVPHFGNYRVPIMRPDSIERHHITGNNSLTHHAVGFYKEELDFTTRVTWQHKTMNQKEALEHSFAISQLIFDKKIMAEDFCFAPYRNLLPHPSRQSSVMSYKQQKYFNLGWRDLYSDYLNGVHIDQLKMKIPNWLKQCGINYAKNNATI